MELNENQKKFIVNFLMNIGFDKIDVARKMVELGYCITPTNFISLSSYMSNYITKEVCKDSVGCVTLTLNIKELLKTHQFKSQLETNINSLKHEISEMESEMNGYKDLLDEINNLP